VLRPKGQPKTGGRRRGVKNKRTAALVDPTFTLTESVLREVVTAARTMGLRIQVLNASTSREINAAFATLVPRGLTGNSQWPDFAEIGCCEQTYTDSDT
jgi:hypothetical protein